MLHRDVDLLKTGKIKPSDTYPPAFGAPPRIETRDIKPLPFGYGQGSSTKALWLMEQARKVYEETLTAVRLSDLVEASLEARAAERTPRPIVDITDEAVNN